MSRQSIVRDALLAAGVAVLAAIGCLLGVSRARAARIDFGPTDAGYLSGFRPDWERDGLTTFRWTGLTAAVRLPLLARGEGFRLQLRARRHFLEPAQVRVAIDGETAGRFEIAADPKTPYLLFDIPLPPLSGRRPFGVQFETRSENPRPLGFALDWMQIERDGAGTFGLLPTTVLGIVLLALTAFLAPLWAGVPRWLAFLHAVVCTGALSFGAWWAPLAVERVTSLGLLPYVATAAIVVWWVRWNRAREVLGVPSGALAGGMALVVLVALAIRLWILLHPQFFYPDVQVHGLMVWRLGRDGPLQFLADFIGHQYRYSLGLQVSNGHWYAFPYPPAFYLLCWPLVGFLGYRPEVAVCLVGAVVNSLAALLVFAIVRRLGARAGMALAASAAVPVLPIFLTRLSLAYFPAILGQAVDALVILYLVARFDETHRPKVALTLGLLLAGAFLTYTQSLLNFGLILLLSAAIQIAVAPGRLAWRRVAGLAAAGVIGLLVSVGLFYYRYVPIIASMAHGRPVAEERALVQSGRVADPTVADAAPSDDPYSGPGLNPWRGLRKTAARLRIFYGWFTPLVVIGVGLIAARAPTTPLAAFSLAWASTYLLLNLASGGLPGPNLVRYNKDLEIVAPLFCGALAACGGWLWERGRPGRILALAYGVAFYAFGFATAARLLAERTVINP